MRIIVETTLPVSEALQKLEKGEQLDHQTLQKIKEVAKNIEEYGVKMSGYGFSCLILAYVTNSEAPLLSFTFGVTGSAILAIGLEHFFQSRKINILLANHEERYQR